jgi:hypothetical protein
VSAAAPDLVAPVVGFRAWRIVGDRLLSPYIPCRWEGRVLHALCFDANRSVVAPSRRGWVTEPHDSPHPDCLCGIYAYHRPGAQAYYGEFHWTEGVISCWGRIEAHRHGLRAEHARVEVLARPPANEPDRRRAVEATARRLDVELVPRAELPDVAAGRGGVLPPSLRP